MASFSLKLFFFLFKNNNTKFVIETKPNCGYIYFIISFLKTKFVETKSNCGYIYFILSFLKTKFVVETKPNSPHSHLLETAQTDLIDCFSDPAVHVYRKVKQRRMHTRNKGACIHVTRTHKHVHKRTRSHKHNACINSHANVHGGIAKALDEISLKGTCACDSYVSSCVRMRVWAHVCVCVTEK